MRSRMLLGLLVTFAIGGVGLLVSSAYFRTKLNVKEIDLEARAERDVNVSVETLERRGDAPAPEDEVISRLQFLDETHGWASNHRRVWRTRNGGHSWQLDYCSVSN
jgi:hypothetical protein